MTSDDYWIDQRHMAYEVQEPKLKIGDRVVIIGGFEDGVIGHIVADEPLEPGSPHRWRVRIKPCTYCGRIGPCLGSARTAGGRDLERFEDTHPNSTTIGGLTDAHLTLVDEL